MALGRLDGEALRRATLSLAEAGRPGLTNVKTTARWLGGADAVGSGIGLQLGKGLEDEA